MLQSSKAKREGPKPATSYFSRRKVQAIYLCERGKLRDQVRFFTKKTGKNNNPELEAGVEQMK